MDRPTASIPTSLSPLSSAPTSLSPPVLSLPASPASWPRPASRLRQHQAADVPRLTRLPERRGTRRSCRPSPWSGGASLGDPELGKQTDREREMRNDNENRYENENVMKKEMKMKAKMK